MRFAFLVCIVACGARTELGVAEPATLDASLDVIVVPQDAGIDQAIDVHEEEITIPDVQVPDTPVVPCDDGTIVSDVFGSTIWWNGGAALPAGHYRVTYVDGCMKYSTGQDWSVNAYANGTDSFLIVTTSMMVLGTAPGTVGFEQGQGGFSSFDDCVNANASDAAFEFDFTGGPIGVWLSDSPYTDNVAGESNRNPTYHLSSCH